MLCSGKHAAEKRDVGGCDAGSLETRRVEYTLQCRVRSRSRTGWITSGVQIQPQHRRHHYVDPLSRWLTHHIAGHAFAHNPGLRPLVVSVYSQVATPPVTHATPPHPTATPSPISSRDISLLHTTSGLGPSWREERDYGRTSLGTIQGHPRRQKQTNICTPLGLSSITTNT